MSTHQSRRVSVKTVIVHDEMLLDEEIMREILTSGVLAGHTADLSQFKNESGEFKRWLHIFHVANRPVFHDTNLKVTTVLPWCTPTDEIDPEFHRAVAALNGYEKYPLAWKSFSWHLPALENSPIYAVFTSNPSQHSFHSVIKERTGFDPKHLAEGTEQEFWERMKQFVIIPRQDGLLVPTVLRATKPRSIVNANSGPIESGPEMVREWSDDPSRRPPWLR